MSTRKLDLAAVVVLAAGWLYLLLGGDPDAGAPAVDIPVIAIRTDAAGVKLAVVDQQAMGRAFARAGLPDPPDLNGADPVPVEVLLGFARQWARAGDVEALGRLGQVYQALELHEPALGCFAAAAELDPANVLWRYGVGVECQALGLDGAAVESLSRAAGMDPDYAIAWARLGSLHLQRQELDEAHRCWVAYRSRQPDRSLGWIGLGRVALARGDAQGAVTLLETAVDRSPDDYMAHRFLGRAYAAGGRADLALAEEQVADRLPRYTGWLQFDRRVMEAHELAGTQRHLTDMLRLASSGGDWQLSRQIAETLLRRRPDDWNMLANLARIDRKLGRLDEAQQAVGRALSMRPGIADLHVAGAEIAFTRRDYEGADRILDRALELDPGHAGAWELRARIRYVQGRLDEALTTVQRSIDLDPGASAPRIVLATILWQSGRAEDAATALTLLLQHDPANSQARALLERIRGPSP